MKVTGNFHCPYCNYRSNTYIGTEATVRGCLQRDYQHHYLSNHISFPELVFNKVGEATIE